MKAIMILGRSILVRKIFLNGKNIFNSKVKYHITKDSFIDIDTKEDFLKAKKLFNYFIKSKT